MNQGSTPEVTLDLTASEVEGFDLLFRTSVTYLKELRRQVGQNEFDGSHSVALEIPDVHPVAARVDRHLSSDDYDSIGETYIGPENPYQESDQAVILCLSCNRNHLRRFAAFNRVALETPITFTVVVPAVNATDFVRSVEGIVTKVG